MRRRRQLDVRRSDRASLTSRRNFMMYTRASADDYNEWKTDGWSAEDLLPLLQKTETFQAKGNEELHGKEGPLKVRLHLGKRCSLIRSLTARLPRWACNSSKRRSSAASRSKRTSRISRRVTQSPNDTSLVCCAQRLTSARPSGSTARRVRRSPWLTLTCTGKRSDVAHHFLYSQSANKNLRIISEHKVKRVIFDGEKAVGAEIVPNKALQPNASQEIKTIHASRLVVVASGAMGRHVLASSMTLTLQSDDPRAIRHRRRGGAEAGGCRTARRPAGRR